MSNIKDSIFVSTVVPIFGVVTAVAVVVAPLPEVWSLRHANSHLGSLNPLPFAFIYVNALAWLFYGIQINDQYIITPNIFGFILGAYYLRSTYLLAKPLHRKWIDAATSIFPFSLLTTTSVLLRFPDIDLAYVLGWFCIVALVAMYGSPLSTMVNVIRRRNAQSLHPAFAVTSLCNGLLWSVYGFFVITDPFVWGPNFLGAVFATFQLLCMLILGRRPDQSPLIPHLECGTTNTTAEPPSPAASDQNLLP